MTAVPKSRIIRDRKYLDFLHTEPCIITGVHGHDRESVVPMHVGTLGTRIKSSDDETLPILNRFHIEGHGSGEISMLRRHAPDDLLRDAFRALARERYREWKSGKVPF